VVTVGCLWIFDCQSRGSGFQRAHGKSATCLRSPDAKMKRISVGSGLKAACYSLPLSQEVRFVCMRALHKAYFFIIFAVISSSSSLASSKKYKLEQDRSGILFVDGLIDSGMLGPCFALIGYHRVSKRAFAIHVSNTVESTLRKYFFEELLSIFGSAKDIELFVAGGASVEIKGKPGHESWAREMSQKINKGKAEDKLRVERLAREYGFENATVQWFPKDSYGKLIFDIGKGRARMQLFDSHTDLVLYSGEIRKYNLGLSGKNCGNVFNR